MSSMNSKGRALITGASTGIGATYAERLARRGYDLILVARDQQRMDTLAARLREDTAVDVQVLKADLTVKDDLARVEQRLRQDQEITLLVNNAGMAVSGELISVDPAQVESMILLNVLAPTRLAAAAVAGFVARGRGTLINISSVLALAPELFNGSYSATKAYILNLTQSLQKEAGSKGVRVQAVLPGGTLTEIWERAGTDISQLPSEMFMRVDELVDAALAGLDSGELITIPSLPDVAEWQAFTDARLRLGPNLSRNHPATRYQVN